MHFKLRLLPPDEIFFGFKFSIHKIVKDVTTYSPDKEYPRAYILDIGFLLGILEITFKGSN
jgi:hypothetical protein